MERATVASAGRKSSNVYLLADLIEFLRDLGIEDPEEFARTMLPKDFPAKLLMDAAKAGRAKAFSALLQFWLMFGTGTGIRPPKGVFAIDLFDLKRLGRPRSPLAQRVYAEYGRIHKPTFWKVAKKVFPNEFEKDPKQAADRARQLHRSYEEYLKRRLQALREIEDAG
jgi:hypothetical protein